MVRFPPFWFQFLCSGVSALVADSVKHGPACIPDEAMMIPQMIPDLP
jgi:hypothetical protein